MQRGGTVKFHRDIAPGVYRHHFGVLDVLPLKNGGEYHQCFPFARAKHKYRGDTAVSETLLLGSRHHAPSVKTSVHGGRQPYLVIRMAHAVYRDNRVGGVIVEQKALDGNRGIVDRLVCCTAQPIAHFTAVTVNAVAYAIDKKERNIFP